MVKTQEEINMVKYFAHITGNQLGFNIFNYIQM